MINQPHNLVPIQNRPLHVIVPCKQYAFELLKFSHRKVNEYLTFFDSTLFKSIVMSHLELPGVARFHPNGVQKYVLEELIDGIANLTCYNIVVRSLTNELVTLFVMMNSMDTFCAGFTTDYNVDQKKLIEMLISNESHETYTHVVNQARPNEDPLLEYVDSFNITMLRMLLGIFEYIITTSREEFMSIIMNIGTTVHSDISDCGNRGIISPMVRPYSVFVSKQTFDIIIVNS